MAHAQTPLYEFTTQGGGLPSPLPYINSQQTIDLDFEAIKAFPDSIQLEFMDGTVTVIQKGEFYPRSGYLFRDEDTDPPETPPYWVNPDAMPSDFSFMWSGSNDEYDIVITAYKGLLSATISGNTARYFIKNIGENYQLSHILLTGFPSYEDDTITDVSNRTPTQITNHQDNSSISNLKSFNYESKDKTHNRDANNPNILDMLIVYNEDARIEAGSTLIMEQQIIAEIDNLNTALANSLNSTRVTRFHVAEVSDFEHVIGVNLGSLTLVNLRDSVSVQNLRNQVGADIVSGILESNVTSFNACGRAFGQTAQTNPAFIGAGFSELAYNITLNFCIGASFTFTHEFGHLLGAHHARDEAFTPVSTVVANGFPYAFAHRNETFKSVLSITKSNTFRRLNFSNPNVQVNGLTTGVVDFSHNQRVIDELTVFATNYRQRPDLIFTSGFE